VSREARVLVFEFGPLVDALLRGTLDVALRAGTLAVRK
jgi:hypothetical protein